MRVTNSRTIMDLCSGGGGCLLQIRKILSEDKGIEVTLFLSDKYPNMDTLSKITAMSNPDITYIPSSVDATDVPQRYSGFRTLFTSLHHFCPGDVRKIIQDAVKKGKPIGIFEFTERTLSSIIKALFLGPLGVIFQTPFIRPFKWTRILWTHVIPISPIVFAWDAAVSSIRSYTTEELKRIVDSINCKGYHWDIGRREAGSLYFNITYLIGYNK